MLRTPNTSSKEPKEWLAAVQRAQQWIPAERFAELLRAVQLRNAHPSSNGVTELQTSFALGGGSEARVDAWGLLEYVPGTVSLQQLLGEAHRVRWKARDWGGAY